MKAWPDNPFLLTGREAEFVPYSTPAGRDEIRALLQRTLDEGTFIDLFFHRVMPAEVTALRALLEIVEDFRARVLPYWRATDPVPGLAYHRQLLAEFLARRSAAGR